jgi:hypothetical protein
MIFSGDNYFPRQRSGKPEYFAGLDLGQSQDFTALAIIEKHEQKDDEPQFFVRHLQRWQLRTSYPTIVADTVRIMHSKELQGPTYPMLAVDATGVGAPVVDLFKRESMKATLKPVVITGGVDETRENGTYRVPKRNLVSMVQVPLQQNRLKIAPELPEAQTLVRELQNFQVKISDTAHDSYGAWREGAHDDLVLAVALAMWTTTGGPGIFFSM